MSDFIWTPNGPIPRNWWEGNQFYMPPAAMPQRQFGALNFLPDIAPDGILTTTNAVPNAPFVTEGTGRNQGPGEAGLGRGPADIGYSKGQATADTTTTATDNTRDFAKSALAGVGLLAGGLPAAMAVGSHTLTGNTPMGHLAAALGRALGISETPQSADLAMAVGAPMAGLTSQFSSSEVNAGLEPAQSTPTNSYENAGLEPAGPGADGPAK